jgi:Ca2+-binding EF-hand superfamily protein
MKLKLIVLTAALAIGGLTASAFARGGGHHGQFGPRKASAEELAKFDANNDGKLDDAEKAKALEARKAMRAKKHADVLAKFDANKNGTLDDAEKAAMRDERITARFAMLDANKDGVVTLAEMKAAKPLGGKGKGHKNHGRGHRLAE